MEQQEYFYTYAKTNDMPTFKAIDINEGTTVGRLSYATTMQNTAENQKTLQRLADNNSNNGLQIQLRSGRTGRSVFQTTLN